MEGKGLIKYSLLSLLLGFIPIVVVFVCYYISPDSAFLRYLFSLSSGHELSYSEEHYNISVIASTYTKIAPLFPVVMFVLFRNKLDIHTIKLDMKRWLRLLPVVILFTTGMYFFLYLGGTNLSANFRGIIKLIARDEYLLLPYYLGIFLTNYFFIWLFLFYCYPVWRSRQLKKRG
ncbi:hypothetical protein F3J29_11810 [Enterobacter sp. Cy-643]|uniref:hypothetical protein n=1 Tax=Enterobacter sp. Cy-643 TaxID=2608346 RepID=UPI00141ECB66|nr:hypothetical protein [Enterobacter sp. Cy-643]NIF32814.1 hypothetical protein [Enterobacter sp. Cy-643]